MVSRPMTLLYNGNQPAQARGRGFGSLSGTSFPRSCVGMPSATLGVVLWTRQGTQSVPDDAPTRTVERVNALGFQVSESSANRFEGYVSCQVHPASTSIEPS